MTDIATAAAHCTCDDCIAFDARPAEFMVGAIVHSANDFAPARCPHCGELARAGSITCGRSACRDHNESSAPPSPAGAVEERDGAGSIPPHGAPSRSGCITADTITDEQIRELRSALFWEWMGGKGTVEPIAVCDAALNAAGAAIPPYGYHCQRLSQAQGRERAAEILNARAKEQR